MPLTRDDYFELAIAHSEYLQALEKIQKKHSEEKLLRKCLERETVFVTQLQSLYGHVCEAQIATIRQLKLSKFGVHCS
jgi:hypothetical protein